MKRVFMAAVSTAFALALLACRQPAAGENEGKNTNTGTEKPSAGKESDDPVYFEEQKEARNKFFSDYVDGEYLNTDETDSRLHTYIRDDNSTQHIYGSPIYTFSEAEYYFPEEIKYIKSVNSYGGRVAGFESNYDRLKARYGDNWRKAFVRLYGLRDLDGGIKYIQLCEVTDTRIIMWEGFNDTLYDIEYFRERINKDVYAYKDITIAPEDGGDESGGGAQAVSVSGAYGMSGSSGELVISGSGTSGSWSQNTSQAGAVKFSDCTWTLSGKTITLKGAASGLTYEETFSVSGGSLTFVSAKVITGGQPSDITTSFIMQNTFGLSYTTGTMTRK